MSEELKGFFLMIIAACVLWIAIILAVTLVPIKEDISAARKCAEIMLQESRGGHTSSGRERQGPNLECGPEKTAVTINGDEFEADTEMIPLLKELNKVGLTTTQHCAGHSEGDTAYLSLEMKSDMEVGIRYDVKPRLVITWKKT